MKTLLDGQGLRFQQNLAAHGVGVVVMVAPTNRLPDWIPLAPAVEAAFAIIRPGDAIEVC